MYKFKGERDLEHAVDHQDEGEFVSDVDCDEAKAARFADEPDEARATRFADEPDEARATRLAEEPFLFSFASLVKAATCFCNSRFRL